MPASPRTHRGVSVPDEPQTVSSLLRRFRLRAGLSQESLAERAAMSAPAISALERGHRQRPHANTLRALSSALHLKPAECDALLAAAARQAQEARRTEHPAPALASPSARWRLPVPPTTLIGRDAEVAQASELLDGSSSSTRLLTLFGPGGVGKTRLALAVAAKLVGSYANGVVFVDLAPLHDARLVAASIARALELRESGGRSARELVLDYLHDRRVLLVLDNFEHLLDAAALVGELLQACPQLVVLVTSRTVLWLRAERRFPVEPLATPVGEQPSLGAIADAPAVQLFVERATAVAPDFVLDAGNAPAIVAVCRRLDGMPLALELAAARAGLLQPEALLHRLARRLTLLTSGAPDLPYRQRTLRTTLAWSHDLLGPLAQILSSAWPSSPGVGRWKRPRPSAQALTWRPTRCSSSWVRWPTTASCTSNL